MKIAELGLKTKPETKYVAGGYISFQTINHVLSYKITRVTKTNLATIDGGLVRDKGHLDLLLKCKTVKEVIQLD